MTKDRFKQNRKKTFKGHNTAGYACQVNFSPDSKYVMSGA
jgi:pre-mRNA-processing factor 17